MHRSTALRAAALFLGASVIPLGCGKSSRSGDQAAITGRIAEIPGPAAEDITVTAHRIETDGSLTNVSKAPVGTTGKTYRVVVRSKYVGEGEFLTKAQKDGGNGYVLVAERIDPKDEVVVAPIDSETSVEAEAFITARSKGAWRSDIGSQALFRFFIPPEAAAFRSNESYADHLEAISNAANSAMLSWFKTLSNEFEVPDGEMRSLRDSIRSAQIDFDAAMNLAQAVGTEDEARATFENELFDAHDNLGIPVYQVAQSSNASATVALSYASGMPASLARKMVKRTELARSRAVRGAVTSELARLPHADDYMENVRNAGDKLSDQLRVAFSDATDIESAIESSWRDYQNDVLAQLEALLSEQGERQQDEYRVVVTAIETGGGLFEGLVEALDAVDAALSADASSTATSAAFGEFFDLVVTPDHIGNLTDAGLTTQEAKAVLRILVLIESATV